MSWRQTARAAGGLMLLLVVALVLAFFFAGTPDASRDEIAGDLEDIEGDAGYLFGQALGIFLGLAVPVLGAALYATLRRRDPTRLLPAIGLAGFVGMGPLFLVSGAAYITLEGVLANDFVSEGAGGAGAPEILEMARVLTTFGDLTFFLGIMLLAVGLIGFGLAIALEIEQVAVATAPSGPGVRIAAAVVSPPRWLGWIATAAGILYLLGFLAAFEEIFFIFIALGLLLTIVWFLAGGVWFAFSAPALVEDVEEAV
ncbi:MAG: hypothetical protein GEU28_05730 [Dehalococcoidia bacterium]|nr:hypothetical protein [Dehalococcoidia bacterium]